ELIALASKPGSRISYGSPGVGNTIHLASELFNVRAGTRMVHVPYKGAGPALSALLAGEIQVMFATAPLSLPHIRSGKLRAIAYNSVRRASFLPDDRAGAHRHHAGSFPEAGRVQYQALRRAGAARRRPT
ncbi:MAG: tripartite tricarboxylate transporter substrate-binding protein, partial [Burkholderiales bacterium]